LLSIPSPCLLRPSSAYPFQSSLLDIHLILLFISLDMPISSCLHELPSLFLLLIVFFAFQACTFLFELFLHGTVQVIQDVSNAMWLGSFLSFFSFIHPFDLRFDLQNQSWLIRNCSYL